MLTAAVVIPLLDTIMLYLLESQYFLNNLSNELSAQAILIAKLIEKDAAFWSEPTAARHDGSTRRAHPGAHHAA